MNFKWLLYSERLEVGARLLMFQLLNTLAGPYSIWELAYSPLKGRPMHYHMILDIIATALENEFGQRPSIGAIKNQIHYAISTQVKIPDIDYFEICSSAALEAGFIDSEFFLSQRRKYLTNCVE